MKRGAALSPCGTYRYELSRRWREGNEVVSWIMLNPSTADANIDDPTIRRCIDFSQRWGCDSLTVRNLFALRATNPRELTGHADPTGPDNDRHLAKTARCAATIVAWGVSGGHLAHERAEVVLAALRAAGVEPLCLGMTKSGAPRHPLYVPAATLPRPFPDIGAAPAPLPGQAALFSVQGLG